MYTIIRIFVIPDPNTRNGNKGVVYIAFLPCLTEQLVAVMEIRFGNPTRNVQTPYTMIQLRRGVHVRTKTMWLTATVDNQRHKQTPGVRTVISTGLHLMFVL